MAYIKMEYCPYQYKYQLVQWAINWKGMKRYRAQKITKRGLYAMWYKRNN